MSLGASITALIAAIALAPVEVAAVQTPAPSGCPDFTRKAIAFPKQRPIDNAPSWVNSLQDTNFNDDASITRTISIVKNDSVTSTMEPPLLPAVVTMEVVDSVHQDINGTVLLRHVSGNDRFGPRDGDVVSRNSAVLPGDKLVFVYNRRSHRGHVPSLASVTWERYYEYGSDEDWADIKGLPAVPGRCEPQPYVAGQYREEGEPAAAKKRSEGAEDGNEEDGDDGDDSQAEDHDDDEHEEVHADDDDDDDA